MKINPTFLLVLFLFSCSEKKDYEKENYEFHTDDNYGKGPIENVYIGQTPVLDSKGEIVYVKTIASVDTCFNYALVKAVLKITEQKGRAACSLPNSFFPYPSSVMELNRLEPGLGKYVCKFNFLTRDEVGGNIEVALSAFFDKDLKFLNSNARYRDYNMFNK